MRSASSESTGYELVDSGGFRKLERFGPVLLDRPCAQAAWHPRSPSLWATATARFTREGGNRWEGREKLPATWNVVVDGLTFKLSSTDFGHLGIFPEQRPTWKLIRSRSETFARTFGRQPQVLNLFAYSGGSTLAAAAGGAAACHVDASKGMVDWARENASLNAFEEKPIRWIVEDVAKFLEREHKRGRTYDIVILDPPSFGRGARGEVFKIENDLPPLLARIRKLLSPEADALLLSCHTPELTPVGLGHLVDQATSGLPGRIETGEMLLGDGDKALPVPSGSYARWLRNN
jgi:23S rRNA (cytosine1962-C5)-methyltransferase